MPSGVHSFMEGLEAERENAGFVLQTAVIMDGLTQESQAGCFP